MKIQDGIQKTSEQICSILLIGQSNMAGRGAFGEVEPIHNPSCYMLRMGRWQKMSEPINVDRAIFEGGTRSGVSLGASFADGVAKATEEMVGLIPCADGGTSLFQWMPGEILYDHAIAMAKLAMRNSKLCGILWHQGEGDCKEQLNGNYEERVRSYKERFITMITALRRELGAEEIPLLIGELSERYGSQYNMGESPAYMNRMFRELEEELPCCKVIEARELPLKEDNLHFCSRSLRVLGTRYCEGYLSLTHQEKGK